MLDRPTAAKLARSLALTAALVALLGAAACKPAESPEALHATGTIVVDDVSLAIPKISTSPTASAAPIRVASALVRPGSHVTGGQKLLVLDDSLTASDVEVARTAAAAAHATADLLTERQADLASKYAETGSKRTQVDATIADLVATRTALAARLAGARAALAAASAQPVPSPSVDPTAAAMAAARLSALRSAVAQLEAAIAKLDACLAKARAGAAAIASARVKLADARSTLTGLAGVAELAADAADAGVSVAQAMRDLGTIVAPADGTLIESASTGDVLFEGAPAAVVRPTAAQRVRIWLTLGQVEGIELGDDATVRVDSLSGAYSARVTFIGTKAVFPPTSLSTRVIHLVRAVAVDVTVDADAILPAGTPADVTIEP